MTILGIDTSNQSMALCLYENEKIIGNYTSTTQKNHSVTLMPAINFLMTSNGLKPSDLTKVVIAEGPGSYTGLRIGVTTAKTLAWTLGIELASISSLAVLAASKRAFEGLIVPLFNARRNNVYTGAYEWLDGKLVPVIGDKHAELEEWLTHLLTLNRPIFLVGPELAIFSESLEKFQESDITYSPSIVDNDINATSFYLLDRQTKAIKDIDAFVPTYLKKVEAEEKWLEENRTQEDVNYVERV